MDSGLVANSLVTSKVSVKALVYRVKGLVAFTRRW